MCCPRHLTGRKASTSVAIVGLYPAFLLCFAGRTMLTGHQLIYQVLKGREICCAGLQGSTSETNLPPVSDADKDMTAPKPQPGALPRSLSTPHYTVRLTLSHTPSSSQQCKAELVRVFGRMRRSTSRRCGQGPATC